METILEYSLKNHISLVDEITALNTDIIKMRDSLLKCFRSGGKLLIAGNGGSAADSQHFAAELTGRFERKDRNPLPAIALTTDTSAITAIGNDYDFQQIFSKQLSALGNMNDIFFVISTSGNSQNLIDASNLAIERGIKILSLTGNSGGKLKDISHLNLNINSSITKHIQEWHIFLIHVLCTEIEANI